MKEVYLFKPTFRNLIYEYPELAQIPEFANITNKHLLFVWYYANYTSPFYHVANEKERIKKSLSESNYSPGDKDYANLINGDFHQPIRDAINKMRNFNPSARFRAKMNIEKIFNNLEKLLDIPEKNLSTMDMEEKKKYADLSIKISESLPTIVKQLETGFGIRTEEENKEDRKNLPSLADTVLSNMEIED